MIDFKLEGQRWLRQARRDLNDAGFNRKGGRFNVACFLAQQAAEKSLKAYLYAGEKEIVWGHSAGDLCERCVVLDAEFEKISDAASALDKYYIPTRYPNALPGGIPSEAFDEVDAQRSLVLSQEILDFVTLRLESP